MHFEAAQNIPFRIQNRRIGKFEEIEGLLKFLNHMRIMHRIVADIGLARRQYMSRHAIPGREILFDRSVLILVSVFAKAHLPVAIQADAARLAIHQSARQVNQFTGNLPLIQRFIDAAACFGQHDQLLLAPQQ